MFKRFLKRVLWVPTIHMPTITFPTITSPTIAIPFKKITTVLGAINTSILVLLGGLGLAVSYVNPIPFITPYIPLILANELFNQVVYL